MSLPYTKTEWDETTAITEARLNNQENGIANLEDYVDTQLGIANTNIVNGKTLLATAITNKDVASTNTDTYTQMAEKIDDIRYLDSFFGSGSDGALNTSGNVTLPSTLNGGVVVKEYTSVNINAGHALTVSNPCQGLIIYSQGDVTINGTISMTEKAGVAPNGNIIPMMIPKFRTGSEYMKFFELTNTLQNLKGGIGGNGGYGGGNNGLVRSLGGIGGQGRQNLGGFGGGGGGGSVRGAFELGYIAKGGDGGSIEQTEVSGSFFIDDVIYNIISGINYPGINGNPGCGGKPAIRRNNFNGLVGIYPKTGECRGSGSGGCGGLYFASTSDAAYAIPTDDSNYAGGFILIITGGNIIIGVSGKLECNGGNGTNGSNASVNFSNAKAGGGGGGGGAGGGVAGLYHKGAYTNNGTIEANGGEGGLGGLGSGDSENGQNGTSGGVGTIHISQL